MSVKVWTKVFFLFFLFSSPRMATGMQEKQYSPSLLSFFIYNPKFGPREGEVQVYLLLKELIIRNAALRKAYCLGSVSLLPTPKTQSVSSHSSNTIPLWCLFLCRKRRKSSFTILARLRRTRKSAMWDYVKPSCSLPGMEGGPVAALTFVRPALDISFMVTEALVFMGSNHCTVQLTWPSLWPSP